MRRLSPEQIERLPARDREYYEACLEHGIEPELPNYVCGDARPSENADFADATHGNRNGAALRHSPTEAPPPLPRPPALDAGEALLELLIGSQAVPAAVMARAAGIRCLVLSWLLVRGPLAGLSLSEIAAELKCTRAVLSWHARRIETATGLHGRGQKPPAARANYRTARIRYVEAMRREGGEDALRKNRRGHKAKAAPPAPDKKLAA